MSTTTELPKTPPSLDPENRGFHFRDLGKMMGGGQSTLRQFGILGSLVVIIIIFQIWTQGLTLSPGNLINVVNQYSYILILAIGMVMVIIMGHIDLSVGSVAAFVGIVVAKSMSDWHFPSWAAVLLGLGVGVLVGAWQGFWVAFVGVPAFIVTLAGMLFFRGANQWVGQSTSVAVPNDFQYIGAGYLGEIALPLPFNVPTMILALLAVIWVVGFEFFLRASQRKAGTDVAPVWVSVVKVVILSALILVAGYQFASGRVGTSFPVSGVILLVLVIIYTFVTRNTVFGRHLYAVGGNRQAARLSGVKDRWTDFFVMMNMSVLASVAAMIYVARADRLRPAGRQRLGARCDRLGLHRRRRGLRRHRDRDRIHHRWSGHGVPEQRHGAARRRRRRRLDGQGPRPAAGRRRRRVEQAAGPSLPHRVHHPPVLPQGRAVPDLRFRQREREVGDRPHRADPSLHTKEKEIT